jgi:hypothetical protein
MCQVCRLQCPIKYLMHFISSINDTTGHYKYKTLYFNWFGCFQRKKNMFRKHYNELLTVY